MYRLLIADDEMIERAVLYKTLRTNLGEECAIFQAENGREALRIYEEEKIQVAILDIEMPGINGIEAAQRIREMDKNCCIIFLTAFDEFSYARKAITVRALDYLLKPYEEKELMLVVEEALRQVKEREEAEAQAAKRDSAGQQTVGWNGTGQNAARNATSWNTAADGELENVRLSKVAEIISHYIREHYMFDISMQDLAREMNYSEAYFCKLFKQCFGQNFTSYLTEFRVTEAKKLLEQPTVNVKDIGKAVGYMDSNYFAKVFKRITGKSPTEYRLSI